MGLRISLRVVAMCVSLVLPLAAIAADEAKKPAFDPTDRYDVRVIEGWTARISDRYADEPKLLDDVLSEIAGQFQRIVEVVPAPAVEKLRQIEIWVEVDNPQFPCMCYHANERWLRANGVNPKKTGHVELANGRNFLSWTKHQPWMILHELAHGYHARFIEHGYENNVISAALAKSKEMGLYGEVDHIAGRKRDHYAATNPMEYFAESSESYFGKNDFFPYDRNELQAYDPDTLRLMEDLWGVKAVTEEEPRNAQKTRKD